MIGLWTNNAALMPDGWPEYVICTQLYHCLPSELYEQDAEVIARHLSFWNAEQKHRAALNKVAAGKAKAKGTK